MKANHKDPEYTDAKLSKEEIIHLLHLLYGKEATIEELNRWSDVVGGLPKHLIECLERFK